MEFSLCTVLAGKICCRFVLLNGLSPCSINDPKQQKQSVLSAARMAVG
jgi:hypothetical protein